MTAIAEQFARAGVLPRDAEFDVALAKFINQGGTYDDALQRVEAAKRMSGYGQSLIALKGAEHHLPPSRQPIPGEAITGMPSNEGRVHCASSGKPVEGDDDRHEDAREGQNPTVPSPSSKRDGSGLFLGAPRSLDGAAAPVREPTPQQRAASAAAANVMAITIMDTLKIDGRSIGNWTVGEARRSGRIKSREGYILIEASRIVANANGGALLRHVVKPAEMQKIIQKAAEVADAV